MVKENAEFLISRIVNIRSLLRMVRNVPVCEIKSHEFQCTGSSHHSIIP